MDKNNKFINLLGYNVFSDTKDEILKLIQTKKKVNIISGNPEVLYTGIKNEKLFNSFNGNNSIIIPDGVGIIIASKLTKQKIKEKIAGIELMDSLLKIAEVNKKKVYFLGSTEEVVKECVAKILKKYPKIKVSGYNNGYFNIDSCNEIIDEINKKEVDYLFIAMGCPRQETFIDKYISLLNCEVFMGVGGSFDVIAGNVKRAPKFMINLGLEWLYRVIKEPFRIKRLGSIPKFLFMVLKDRRKRG